jgi:hypothetical protein
MLEAHATFGFEWIWTMGSTMGPTTYKSLKYLYHIYRDRYSKSLMDFLGPPLSRNGTVTSHRPDVSLGRVRADHTAPQRCTLRSPSTDPRDAPGLGGDGANLATDGIWRVAMAFLANDLYPKIHQAKLTFLLWGLKDDGKWHHSRSSIWSKLVQVERFVP